jgi:hypothetical protein
MILHIYVDDGTMAGLCRASSDLGRTVEDLAEAAVAEEVVRYVNSRPARFDEPARTPQNEPLYDGGPGRTRTCNQTVMSEAPHG